MGYALVSYVNLTAKPGNALVSDINLMLNLGTHWKHALAADGNGGDYCVLNIIILFPV